MNFIMHMVFWRVQILEGGRRATFRVLACDQAHAHSIIATAHPNALILDTGVATNDASHTHFTGHDRTVRVHGS